MSTAVIEPPERRSIRKRPSKRGRDEIESTGRFREAQYPAIIAAVRNHFGLFALIVLVVGGILGSLALKNTEAAQHVLLAGLGLLGLVVLAVTMLVYSGIGQSSKNKTQPPAVSKQPNASAIEGGEERREMLLQRNRAVVKDADAPPLTADGLTQELQQLRLVLHQAPRYSTPTYFLDTRLCVVDWNVAFELIFQRILHKIRGRHVNHFIAELENCDEVFDHARDFTRKVENGELPLIDVEPLEYQSEAYGDVKLIKLAAQLTDSDAQLKAWSVSLLVRAIDWTRFSEDLLQHLREHKLWSIYAVSYDAILLKFPGYLQLIDDVLSAIPSDARHVMDLGAGTGNVSKALLERGHRVTAVENNVAMLEKMYSKRLDPAGGKLVLNKNSAAALDSFPAGSFDAVVAVNVLYALEDPLGCIRSVARLLRPGGIFTFSTTTAESELDPLLNAIKEQLQADDRFLANEEHFNRVYALNKDIEINIARRHPRADYEEWVKQSGFQLLHTSPDAYWGAVTVFHCRKI